MTDRLMVAYGLMFLMAVAVGGVIWWTVRHSHRRTYKRRVARERKEAVAADDARRKMAAGASDRA